MAEPTVNALVTPRGPAGDEAVTPAAEPSEPPHPPETPTAARHRRPRRRRVLAWLGVLALVLALGTTAVLARHLWRTAEAWQDRAGQYEQDAHTLGTDLAAERADLAATRAELEAVRDQLAVAHARIVDLANEKAKLGDDNEVQRRLVDYQERVSEAAGTVALALDECVQGQQHLIAVLDLVASAPEPDPDPTPGPTNNPTLPPDPDPDLPSEEEIAALRTEVDLLCEAATEANIALQLELAQ